MRLNRLSLLILPIGILGMIGGPEFEAKFKKCPECPNGKPAPVNRHFESHISEWRLFHCDQIRKMRIQIKDLEKENTQLKMRIERLEEIIGLPEIDRI